MSSLADSRIKITQNIKTISEFESGLALVLDLIAGAKPENKFGHISSAAAVKTDIWQNGLVQPLYIFPDDAGELIEIVSTLADTQTIEIEALDENGLETKLTVVLNGVTPVPIPGAVKIVAVNRAGNTSNTAFTGAVTIRGDGSTSTNIFATISPTEQQTTQAIYVVPSGKIAIILDYSASLNRSGGTNVDSLFDLKIQKAGEVFKTAIIYGLGVNGTSHTDNKLPIPRLAGPLSKIKVTGEPSAALTDLSANFGMMLLDVGLVPQSILDTL